VKKVNISEDKKMPLTAKENYMEAIKYGDPEYVPLGCEPVWYGISFNDMLKLENWKDRFGVTWEMAMEKTVPFPKGNPLADIEKALDKYKFPDPNGLIMDPDVFERLK